ncbi:hypothetical protein LMG19087_03348 [Ralstonia wenshanensis]|nr:hypothetical protein LMG19087_03348 [Ralstonia wenshanensis]
MTLRTKLKRMSTAIAIVAFSFLSAMAHANCRSVVASEPDYQAVTPLAFPSPAAENEFRSALSEQAGLNLEEARMFFDCLKIATMHDDGDTLSQLIRYPLRTGSSKREIIIRTPAAFKKAYPVIFDAKVKHAIETQRFEDLFVSYRGLMVGNGEVWISGIVDPISGKTIIKVIAINN